MPGSLLSPGAISSQDSAAVVHATGGPLCATAARDFPASPSDGRKSAVSQLSRAIAELQMLGKKLEAEDSQYLLGIANSLTRHSTVLEGRIKERHEAICQLFNQMLGALEEINKAYYAHAVELIDIAASLSARTQLVGSGSPEPKAIEADPVAERQRRRHSVTRFRHKRHGKRYKLSSVATADRSPNTAAE